jgi:hypothetical protein
VDIHHPKEILMMINKPMRDLRDAWIFMALRSLNQFVIRLTALGMERRSMSHAESSDIDLERRML